MRGQEQTVHTEVVTFGTDGSAYAYVEFDINQEFVDGQIWLELEVTDVTAYMDDVDLLYWPRGIKLSDGTTARYGNAAVRTVAEGEDLSSVGLYGWHLNAAVSQDIDSEGAKCIAPSYGEFGFYQSGFSGTGTVRVLVR